MASKAEAEILKMRALEERIKAPSVWGKHPCGLRIEDLQENRYEDAMQLVKEHYLNEDVMTKRLNILDDKESTDEFLHNCKIWLRDKMSMAVVKEKNNRLVGVVIMRIQEKSAFSRTFSKVKITHSPVYTKLKNFLNDVQKPVCIFSEYNIRKYLKIYLLALLPRYRHRGITKDLLKAAITVSVNANVPAIIGIFTTGRMHHIAEELNFTKLHEIYYVRYKDCNGEALFSHMGLGNYGAALMGYRIPGVEEPPGKEVPPVQSSRFNVDDGTDDASDNSEEA